MYEYSSHFSGTLLMTEFKDDNGSYARYELWNREIALSIRL